MTAQILQFRLRPTKPPKAAVDAMKAAARLLEEANRMMDEAERICRAAGVKPASTRSSPRARA